MEDEKIIQFPKNEENKTEVEIENYTYRFEEMIEALEQSINNIDVVAKQQSQLAEIVSAATHDYEEKEKKPFDDFIEGMENQNKNLKEQKETLIAKKELIKQVVERCKNDEEHAKTVSILVEALGIFKN